MQENESLGFPTRSNTNQPVQFQKKAKSLKFWNEEEMYYPSNENKAQISCAVADQLCRYCTADLRLFSHRQKSVFLVTRLK